MQLIVDRFIVAAVVRTVDEDGAIVSEQQLEPVCVFGTKALEEWADSFPGKLDALNAEQGN